MQVVLTRRPENSSARDVTETRNSRKIVVDDQRHLLDIDTPRPHVRSDEHSTDQTLAHEVLRIHIRLTFVRP